MRITYLNGTRLKRGFIAGARMVIQRREHLNRINVFPVADSDTGTNMAHTLQVMANSLFGVRDPALYAVARVAADSALEGAQGNSGTILAQFFFGLAESIGEDIRLTTARFGEVVRNAVDYAYRAIAAPKEGTILTVLRDWSESLRGHGKRITDFQELLEAAMIPARKSLGSTREQLRELRRAGVVDAGAQGFVDMLDGIVGFMSSGRIRELDALLPEETIEEHTVTVGTLEEIAHRYCTECLVESLDLDHDELRDALLAYGDSLIIAGTRRKTKIHIHTDIPSDLFGFVAQKGTILKQKIDDMHRQFRISHRETGDCVLVVDSTCDLPPEIIEELNIQVVATHLIFDNAVYIDKLGITPERFFEMMRSHREIVPTTSQPAPGEFLRTFDFLADHYREILYLGLSGGLSGTLQSARMAANRLNAKIEVVDTGQASVGIGLVARRVGEAIRDGASLSTSSALARSLLERTRLFLTVPTLNGLVRSGRIGKGQGRLVDLLNLKPILSLSREGKIIPVGAAVGELASWRRIIRHIKRFVPAGRAVEFAVAHADAPGAVKWLESVLSERFPLARPVYSIHGAPVIIAHTGLGTVGVACTVP